METADGAGGERGFAVRDGGASPEPAWLRRGSPAGERSWNPLAVVSLLAAVTLTPVGLVLGVLALLQLRGARQRGRALAVLGVALGAALLAAYVLLLTPVINAAAGPQR